jgi:hypothetical protein
MCSFSVPRGADFIRSYIFPTGTVFTSYTSAFKVYASLGGSTLLTVSGTATANGSQVTFAQNIVTVTIKAADVATLPVAAVVTEPNLLQFDFFLTSGVSVASKIQGGLFKVYPFGASTADSSDDINVNLGGSDVDVSIYAGPSYDITTAVSALGAAIVVAATADQVLALISAAKIDFSNVTPLTGRIALGFKGDANQLGWGTYFPPSNDGVTDFQFYSVQNQATWSSGGSLGAGYFQRVASYSGGAVNDSATPVTAAVRGYTQIGNFVTWCNEVGGLAVCDNYSWHGQCVGLFGQAKSHRGGRTFGFEAEAIEYPESFTATASQTVFVIPNNYPYNASIVTKNGAQLTRGVDYTETARPGADATGTITAISGTGSVVTVAFSGGFTPPVNYCVDVAGVTPNIYNGRWRVATSSAGNATLAAPGSGTATVLGTLSVDTDLAGSITLTTGATAGDTVVVVRVNPEFATLGGEVIVYAAGGTDTGNAISGNRVGLSISGYRSPTAPNVPTRVGTLLQLVTDPSDTNLRTNRGLLFQGKFETGIDFTASNVNFNNYLAKFNTAGAGISPLGNIAIGDQVPLDTAGYAIMRIRNATNGGLIEIGDSGVLGRFQASGGSGVVIGSDTNTEVVFTQNASERLRLTSALVSANAPVKLRSYLISTVPAASVGAGSLIYVTDLTGGAEPCFSDATNWRRGTDRTVIS